jgi:hypothetical protein
LLGDWTVREELRNAHTRLVAKGKQEQEERTRLGSERLSEANANSPTNNSKWREDTKDNAKRLTVDEAARVQLTQRGSMF